MTDQLKIAIVGAGSLRGKELNDALPDSPFAGADFILMDDESELGSLEAVGDEVSFIQRIEPNSFDRVDFAFFAGDEQLTLTLTLPPCWPVRLRWESFRARNRKPKHFPQLTSA